MNWELGNSVHRGERPACPFDPPALAIFVRGNLRRREACPSCQVVIVRDARFKAHIRVAKCTRGSLMLGMGKRDQSMGWAEDIGNAISFMGRSSCSWSIARRSVCCGRIPFPLKGQLRKRGKNGQIVLPMHFRPQQLRSECTAFIWLDSRSLDASRQTDSYERTSSPRLLRSRDPAHRICEPRSQFNLPTTKWATLAHACGA